MSKATATARRNWFAEAVARIEEKRQLPLTPDPLEGHRQRLLGYADALLDCRRITHDQHQALVSKVYDLRPAGQDQVAPAHSLAYEVALVIDKLAARANQAETNAAAAYREAARLLSQAMDAASK